MSDVGHFVSHIAQTFLTTKVTLPSDVSEKNRNNIILLGMVRACVTMANLAGFTLQDLVSAAHREWQMLEAAKGKVGKG